MTNPDLDVNLVRPRRWRTRAVVAGLCAVASIGAASSAFAPAASAAPVKPPLNCVDDPNQDGCPHDGGGTSGGSVGRTFITARDVTWIGSSNDTTDEHWQANFSVTYNTSEWDTLGDWMNAVKTYFYVQTSVATGCLFSSWTCAAEVGGVIG